MALPTNPTTKFTLKQWIQHPTTILLIAMTAVSWGVIGLYVNAQLARVNDLKERIETLEVELARKDAEMRELITDLLVKNKVINGLNKKSDENAD